MIKLKTLKFKNVGRFTTEQSVDFTTLGNLVQIDAYNYNTGGGSSGSGKSTIFYMILWILGLDTLPTTVLQSRLTDEHISGTIELDWDGKQVVVKRARKLSVTTDGIEVTGSSKIAEEELDKIFGLKRSLFKVLLLKAQGDQGFFLNMGPSKMNEFLVDTLGLSQISSKIDTIDGKAKELAQGKISAQSSLEAAQSALEANKRALAAIGEEPITSVTEGLLEGWKMQCMTAGTDKINVTDRQAVERSRLEAKKPKLTSQPFDSSGLDALRKEENEVNDKINELLSQEKDRQTAFNKEISKLKLELSNRVSDIKTRTNKEITILNSKLADTAMAIKLGAMSKEEAIKIATQIKTIRAGICYTCQQTWVSQDEEAKLLSGLNNHKIKIMAAKQAAADAEEIKTTIAYVSVSSGKDIDGLNQSYLTQIQGLTESAKPQTPIELPDLNAKLRDICAVKLGERAKEDRHTEEQNKANNEVLGAFFVEQKSLATRHQEELQIVNKTLQEASSQHERLKTEFKNHETNLAKHRQLLKTLTDSQNEMAQKAEQAGQKLTQLEEKLGLAEEAKRCLKSYLSCSFDDALDSISETATRILRSVPTMATSTVRLEGTKELGNGSVKDQVTACVDSDGEISVPIKSLSGGERSAVDLAIDLAVAELIQEKANKGIDLMILDEPFGGFDSIGIEHALEMLKTLDKRIVLVEHNPIAKEFMDCKITVIRDGETSYIENKA